MVFSRLVEVAVYQPKSRCVTVVNTAYVISLEIVSCNFVEQNV